MNSRERVLSAIKNRQTDRMCYNFRAEEVTLEKIFRYTGIRDLDALLDMLDVDIRHIDAIKPSERKYDGYYQNYWGERYIYKLTEYGPVREDMNGALEKARTLKELKNFDWVKNSDFDYSEIEGLCRKYEGRAIMYGSADIWQRPGLVRGMENFFTDMYENPEFCHFLCNKFTDFYVEDYRMAYKASGEKIDIFLAYSDLGSQRAPLISKDLLHEFVLPYIKRLADAIHELGAYLFFHSCGMVYPFIEELIEAGVDILDPIQPVCPEMQPENLAKEFGGRVCFHGGIDIQGVLVKGAPEDVREEVRRYKSAFNGSGYICGPSHFFQADTSVENIFAIYDEIIKK